MMPHLSVDDDRALTEMLKEIQERGDLLGVGVDAEQLAALALVTRPASEVADKDHALGWVGLPEHDGSDDGIIKVMVRFDTEAQRDEFLRMIGPGYVHKRQSIWSTWWPGRERDDVGSVRFTDDGEALNLAGLLG